MSVICFVDFSQSEMMLLSSKEMKDDYEMMKFELSNWSDDDVEIDKANWLKDSVADFDDDDFSNWQNIRVETIQKIVLSNWLRNCVEIDEKIREWVDVNQCGGDEKKSEKEKNYKSVLEISLSTTIIEAIIIITIIAEKDEYEDCAHHREDFDCLSICFVEFFDSLSFLREEDWKEISEFDFEKNLREEFVCVACSFAEFSVFENVHFDCEFCDSFLIFSLLSVFESVASLVVSSTLENLLSEDQSSMSFSSTEEEVSVIEKKVVFTSCSSVCVFVSSSIESLFAFVFSVSELSCLIFCVKSSAFLNSEKCEIVREKKKKFLDEKIVIESDVSNFCETNSSNSSSLDKFCIKAVESEEKKKKRRSCFCFEFFAIDFALSCVHVSEIRSLRSVVSVVEKIREYQKVSFRKKRKEKMFFETFNQYRESRSISNESDIDLAKRELSRSSFHQKKTASVSNELEQFRFSTTMTSLQALQMLFRWLIIMLASETSETSLFDEYNITKFLDRYADLCLNYDLEEEEKIRRLFRYCDFINEQYVRVVINANVFEWKELCKTLCRDYKDKDLNQQLHSLEYLEIFKNKMRTSLEEISQYCRQYTIISEKLVKTEKLQRTLRSAWFLQKLLEKFSEKLAIRCSLNENDENKMRFENLIEQALQLTRFRSAIIRARKTEYKTKRTTTLMKEMKSIMRKSVSEHFINLLKTMKSRVEESISSVDVRLDDLTEVMRKMTINVDNLINCVFLSSDRDNSRSSQNYQSYMTSRYSSSNQSLMFDSRSFSMFLQNMSSQNVLLSNMFSASLSNEISRSSSIKCIYCYEKDHLYKRECVKFNENLRAERIHLQKRRIHLDLYNFEAFHVRMILYKSQRQCVENAEKLVYSNHVVAVSIEVHTIRLKKNAKVEFSTDEKKKEVVLVNHELYASVDVILIAARSKSKVSKESAKHHESIRRILKRKVEKEEKLFISKILRSRKWKKTTMKKKNDVRNRVMKEVSQKNVQKREKKLEKKRERSRFAFDKEKDKIARVIKKVKEVQEVASLFARKKVSNKSRIIDIWKNEIDEKEFLIKLKSAQIIFSLIEIIVFASLAQKIFFKTLSDEDVIKFHVNLIRSRSTTQKKEKQWYVCEFSKAKIIIEDVVRIIELMNSEAKIDVMIKRLMNKTKIIMRFESRLRLISHIEHDMNFDEIYDDVELNIEELKTRHHIFVIAHADHQLVLDQFFLTDLSANYDYRSDEVYVVFISSDLSRFVIFKAFDRHDFANRIEKDVFSDDDDSLN